jgi:hypothetical protein
MTHVQHADLVSVDGEENSVLVSATPVKQLADFRSEKMRLRR